MKYLYLCESFFNVCLIKNDSTRLIIYRSFLFLFFKMSCIMPLYSFQTGTYSVVLDLGTPLDTETHTLDKLFVIKSDLTTINVADELTAAETDWSNRRVTVATDAENESKCILIVFWNLGETEILKRTAYGNRTTCIHFKVTDEEFNGVAVGSTSATYEYQASGHYAVTVNVIDLFNSHQVKHFVPVYSESSCQVPLVTFTKKSVPVYSPHVFRRDDFIVIASQIEYPTGCSHISVVDSKWAIDKVDSSTGDYVERFENGDIIINGQSLSIAANVLDAYTTYKITRSVEFLAFTIEDSTHYFIDPPPLKIMIDGSDEYTKYIDQTQSTVTLTAQTLFEDLVSFFTGAA